MTIKTARHLKEKLSKNDAHSATTASTPSTALMNAPPLPPKSEPQSLPEDSKLWNLRNADIRAVINEVSRVTGKNFVIDPRVQG